MIRLRRREIIATAAGLAPGASALRAAEARWRPSRPMRIVVPAPPGGITDIGARLAAAQFQAAWGVPVVVDNRAGGGGIIGTNDFLRAPADGHTLLVGNIGPQAIAYTLYRELPYTAAAFAPVSGLIRGPNVLVLHPSVPAASLPEFVNLLRARPRVLNYGSSGTGQSPHLSAVWFLQMLRAEATHVPFRGSAPALTELLAGNIQFMFENLIAASQHIQAGRLRAFGVTSSTRSPLMRDLPALNEGAPELSAYDVSTWVGLFAHAGAPAEAVAAINTETRRMLSTPENTARLAQTGSEAHVTTTGEFGRFVGAEIEKWRDVIRREGLTMELT